MAKIYTIADIHGHLTALHGAMRYVDLEGDNQLIFLGDYVDTGPNSHEVLEYVMELQEKHGDSKVVALKGNHERSFLQWIDDPLDTAWMENPNDYQTLVSFLSDQAIIDLNRMMASSPMDRVKAVAVEKVLGSAGPLIQWVRNLPDYYDTEDQIYIHDGIDLKYPEQGEEAEAVRKGSEPLYPILDPTHRKDIITGRLKVDGKRLRPHYHGILFDGVDHYYVDGTTHHIHQLSVLVYDTETGEYSSPNATIERL